VNAQAEHHDLLTDATALDAGVLVVQAIDSRAGAFRVVWCRAEGVTAANVGTIAATTGTTGATTAGGIGATAGIDLLEPRLRLAVPKPR